MSNGPISGDKIPPLQIPPGKLVYYVGMVQASHQQYVRLTDNIGHTLLTMTGAAPNRNTPTTIGSGYFTTQDSSQQYTLAMGVNGAPGNCQVLWTENVINLGDKVYLAQYSFISEDAGDEDYNDCCVIIQWFLYTG